MSFSINYKKLSDSSEHVKISTQQRDSYFSRVTCLASRIWNFIKEAANSVDYFGRANVEKSSDKRADKSKRGELGEKAIEDFINSDAYAKIKQINLYGQIDTSNKKKPGEGVDSSQIEALESDPYLEQKRDFEEKIKERFDRSAEIAAGSSNPEMRDYCIEVKNRLEKMLSQFNQATLPEEIEQLASQLKTEVDHCMAEVIKMYKAHKPNI